MIKIIGQRGGNQYLVQIDDYRGVVVSLGPPEVSMLQDIQSFLLRGYFQDWEYNKEVFERVSMEIKKARRLSK